MLCLSLMLVSYIWTWFVEFRLTDYVTGCSRLQQNGVMKRVENEPRPKQPVTKFEKKNTNTL